MQNNNLYLRSNSLLKIHFPNFLTQHHWVIEEKQRKAIYAVPLEGIIMSILCIAPITKAQLLRQISHKFSTPPEQIESILDFLIEKGIISCLDKQDSNGNHFKIVKDWSSAGWGIAAHYYFFTQEAPYLDYSEKGKGLEKVRQKMLEYHLIEPDVKRCKKYVANLGIQQLPNMEDILHSYGAVTKS
jgi:hypothetical protein